MPRKPQPDHDCPSESRLQNNPPQLSRYLQFLRRSLHSLAHLKSQCLSCQQRRPANPTEKRTARKRPSDIKCSSATASPRLRRGPRALYKGENGKRHNRVAGMRRGCLMSLGSSTSFASQEPECCRKKERNFIAESLCSNMALALRLAPQSR